METFLIIIQSLGSFFCGVLVGGLLQSKYRWLDKLVDFIN